MVGGVTTTFLILIEHSTSHRPFRFWLTEYGSGIVFVPCFLALLLIGLPLLLLEISLGQHLQRSSDVSASGHLSKHFRGVGVASIFVVGLGMLSHCYVPLLSWCLRIWFGTWRVVGNAFPVFVCLCVMKQGGSLCFIVACTTTVPHLSTCPILDPFGCFFFFSILSTKCAKPMGRRQR